MHCRIKFVFSSNMAAEIHRFKSSHHSTIQEFAMAIQVEFGNGYRVQKVGTPLRWFKDENKTLASERVKCGDVLLVQVA